MMSDSKPTSPSQTHAHFATSQHALPLPFMKVQIVTGSSYQSSCNMLYINRRRT